MFERKTVFAVWQLPMQDGFSNVFYKFYNSLLKVTKFEKYCDKGKEHPPTKTRSTTATQRQSFSPIWKRNLVNAPTAYTNYVMCNQKCPLENEEYITTQELPIKNNNSLWSISQTWMDSITQIASSDTSWQEYIDIIIYRTPHWIWFHTLPSYMT